MPVSDEHALRQFELEALRGINDVLKDLRSDAKEDRKILHDVRDRVVRIESNKMEADVQRLKEEVEELKEEKLRRDGALGLVQWTFRNWPAVIGYFALIAAIVAANGKIG